MDNRVAACGLMYALYKIININIAYTTDTDKLARERSDRRLIRRQRPRSLSPPPFLLSPRSDSVDACIDRPPLEARAPHKRPPR